MSMLFVGDIHICVSDLTLARRFWVDGLGLDVVEEQASPNSFFARLDFPDGGPSIRLLGPVEPFQLADRPTFGTCPAISFDITTTDFDDLLVRLIENGGTQVDEIETYGGLRHVTVADPDGNEFELLEIQEDAEEAS